MKQESIISYNPYKKPDTYMKLLRDFYLLDFGKYKSGSKTVEDLIYEDPDYLIWLYENGIVNYPDNVKTELGLRIYHEIPTAPHKQINQHVNKKKNNYPKSKGNIDRFKKNQFQASKEF